MPDPDGIQAWPAERAARYRAAGYWRGQSLFEALAQSARRGPQATALVDGAQRRSYAELVADVEALAAGLQALGLRSGQRVVFQLGNGLRLAQSFYALMRLGVVPVMALPAHRRSEIEHFVRCSEAVALFVPETATGHDYRDMAQEVAAACPQLRHIFIDGQPQAAPAGHGATAQQRALDEVALGGASASTPLPAAGAVALMLLSGGTTGMPKLIPRTHDDFLCGCLHAAEVAAFGPQTVFLAMLPMAHNYTLGAPGFVGALSCGATTVIARSTAAETVLPLMARERVSVVSTAAPVIARWLASDWPERCDLSALRVVMCGGSRLAAVQRQRVEERLHCLYQESYGTAEGLLNMTRLDDAAELRHHSSGRPVCAGDEVRVVDAQGAEVPDGECGELQARGPYTIGHYFRAPQADAQAFTADGYYRMGDVVRRVGGYLYVEGRLKEQVNRGGEKISCEEVEGHVLAHPDVIAACVLAAPDPEFGERVCAVVVLRPGASLELEALRRFMQQRSIARFKWPERLEALSELPLSPAGKVLRRALQAQLFAAPAASADDRPA